MTTCDVRMPKWKARDCPGEYNGSHVCRACQLQITSEKHIKASNRCEVMPNLFCQEQHCQTCNLKGE